MGHLFEILVKLFAGHSAYFIVLGAAIILGSIFFEKVPKHITDPEGLNDKNEKENDPPTLFRSTDHFQKKE